MTPNSNTPVLVDTTPRRNSNTKGLDMCHRVLSVSSLKSLSASSRTNSVSNLDTPEIKDKSSIRVASVDGQTAVSYVAYALSDINFIYSSTPSRYLGCEINEWCKKDVKNAYGHTGRYSNLQVKAGAGLVLHGALSVGELGTIYASSDAVRYLLPIIHYLSSNQLSSVMHIDTKHIGDNLVVNVDHSKLMAARDTDCMILNSHSVQEAHDLAIIAHLVTSRVNTPVLHMIDSGNSDESVRTRLLQYNEINSLMQKYGDLEKYREESHGRRNRSVSINDEKNSENTTKIVEDVMRECSETLGVKYAPFQYFGERDAEVVVIVLGHPTQVFVETSRLLRRNGERVGVLKIRLYRPWSASHFVKALPISVKRLIVMDFTSPNAPAYEPGCLFLDVLATVESQIYGTRKPRVIQGKATVQSFTPAMAKAIFEFGIHEQHRSSFTIGCSQAPGTNLELEVKADVSAVRENVSQVVVWQKDEANLAAPLKSLLGTLCDSSELFVQTQTYHDAYKHGGVSSTHVRLSPAQINAPYPICEAAANLVVVTDSSLLENYDVVAALRPGSVLLINTASENVDEDSDTLPTTFKQQVLEANIEIYTFDLNKLMVDYEIVDNRKAFAKARALTAAIVRLAGLAKWEDTLLNVRTCMRDNASKSELSIVDAISNSLTRQAIPETWKDSAPSEIAVTDLSIVGDETETGENEALPTQVAGNLLSLYGCKDVEKSTHTFKKWHKAAWISMFPNSYDTREELRPNEHTSYVVTCSENRRLTPSDYERNVFHIEMDITGTGLKYAIGDALGVWGSNGDEEVSDFLKFYGLNGEDLVGVTRELSHNHDGEEAGVQVQSNIEYRTIWHWLQQVTDLFGRPGKGFYEALANFATDADEKTELLRLCGDDGKADFKKGVSETITFADILKQFPSAHPPVADLVRLIPAIKPRHYSIASSQRMHSNSVHLLVVVHDWTTPTGKHRIGQCTRYLVGVRPGTKMTVCVKPSVMILPPSHKQPCIMSGLGTGMAPFRAFIQERAMAKEAGEEVGPMILYFGSRSRKEEYLYGEELEAYHADGLLSGLRLAFSRDQPHKIYIQHRMMEDKEYLNEYLNSGDGHFYLCGPTWPAGDVRDAIVGSFVEAGGLTHSEATIKLQNLKNEERYILEVY